MSEYLRDPDTGRFPPLRDRHVRVVPVVAEFTRVYPAGGRHGTRWNALRTWGPTGSRFDPHPTPAGDHPRSGVMYAAVRPSWLGRRTAAPLMVSLAEVYRDRGIIELSRDMPYLTVFRPTRDVSLLDLSDSDWVTQAGGNAAVSSGPRTASRKWARAISEHYAGDSLDGVVYASSNVPNGRAVAFWAGVRTALPADPLVNKPLSDPALRATVEHYANELRLGLVN